MIFEDWGLIDYSMSLTKQLEYVEKVISTPDHPGFIIFCNHPATVTTGRQTTKNDITTWDGQIVEVSRGGRATYHGPSQLVVYPIINIKKSRKLRGPQEIRGYIKDLELGIVKALKKIGIESIAKTSNTGEDTGVWIKTLKGEKKIASVGIAIKNWVTYHGAAINLIYDSSAFVGINPCGYSTDTMISAEKILNKEINVQEFKNTLLLELQSLI